MGQTNSKGDTKEVTVITEKLEQAILSRNLTIIRKIMPKKEELTKKELKKLK